MANYNLSANGESRAVNVEPQTPLRYLLRNDLELNGHLCRGAPHNRVVRAVQRAATGARQPQNVRLQSNTSIGR